MRYLSLFSGIGAFEKALKNRKIDYELVGFSEIDKYAIESYCAIHNVNEKQNLGDITKIDLDTLPNEIDLLTHGSPCTNFSIAGKNEGGDKNSGTASSLMWNSVDIIRKTHPKYVIWENVANVLSSKHKHNFDSYLEIMEQNGYNNYYTVLNSLDFGVPQHRERLFCVSILKKIDKGFIFTTTNGKEHKILKDFIEKEVHSRMWVRKPMRDISPIKISKSGVIAVGQTSNDGSQGGKVYSIEGCFPTLCSGLHGYASGYILVDGKHRKLTPCEAFRLMGFTESDFEKCEKLGHSDTQLYRQAGNSIVVPVLESILKNLFYEV